MKNIFIWVIYIIGLIFTGTLLHELYHLYFCGGGDFIAGVLWKDHHLLVATTWCVPGATTAGGELIPNAFEILFDIFGIWLKAKR